MDIFDNYFSVLMSMSNVFVDQHVNVNNSMSTNYLAVFWFIKMIYCRYIQVI